jgi:hypothetical protein
MLLADWPILNLAGQQVQDASPLRHECRREDTMAI